MKFKAAIVIGLLALSSVVIGARSIGGDYLKTQIETALSGSAHWSVTIRGPVAMDLLSGPSIIIDRLDLADRRNGTVITLAQVEAAFALRPLMSGELAVTRLDIGGGQARFPFADRDGLVTIEGLAVATDTAPGTLLSLRPNGEGPGIGQWSRVLVAAGRDLAHGLFAAMPARAADHQDGGSPATVAADSPDQAALLSAAPFDASGLFAADARLKIRLAGIKAAGFQVGPVEMDVDIVEGRAVAEILHIGVYSGALTGSAVLDGREPALSVDADLTLADADIAAVMNAAGRADVGAAGRVSATIALAGQGVSPQELASGLAGSIALRATALSIPDIPVGETVAVTVDVAGAQSPLTAEARLSYDGQPTRLLVTGGSVADMLAGGGAPLSLVLESPLVSATLDGRVDAKARAVDAGLTLRVPSVRAAAAFLGTDYGDTDPGAVAMTGRFSADPRGATLTDFTVTGDVLAFTANGTVDLAGPVPAIVAGIQASLIDLDAYRPAVAESMTGSEAGADDDTPAGPGWLALPETALDLSALDRARLQLTLRVDELRAGGETFRPVNVNAVTGGDGARVEIARLGVAEGAVTGAVALAAAEDGRALVDLVASVQDLSLNALPGASDAIAGGTLSGDLEASTEGKLPRDLVANLAAVVGLRVQDLAGPVDGLGERAQLNVVLDGAGGPLTLDLSAAYAERPVTATIVMPAPVRLLAGEDLPVTAEVVLEDAIARMTATLPSGPGRPVFADLDVQIQSIGALAQAAGQGGLFGRDPGALALQAGLEAVDGLVILHDLAVESAPLSLAAGGQIDLTGTVPAIRFSIDQGRLDTAMLMPASTGASPPPPTDGAAPPAPRDLLAALPEADLDLTLLGGIDADLHLAFNQIQAPGLTVGPLDMVARVADGRATVTVNELAAFGGHLAADFAIVSGEGRADHRLSAMVEADAVLLDTLPGLAEAGMAGRGRLTFVAEAEGRSARALGESLSAKLDLAVTAFSLPGLPLGDTASLALVVPGPAQPGVLKARFRYDDEPVALDGELPPLSAITGAEPVPLTLALSARPLSLDFEGALVTDPEPGVTGDITVTVGSVRDLAAWLGTPLPDQGALSLSASFAAIGKRFTLSAARVESEAASLDAAGSADMSGAVPRIEFEIEGGVIDLDRLLPAPGAPSDPEGGAVDPEPEARIGPDQGPGDGALDLTMLERFAGRIGIKFRQLLWQGHEIGPIDLALSADGGALRLGIADLGLFGGRVHGDVAAALPPVAGDPPSLALDLAFQDIALAPLAALAAAPVAAVTGRLGGAATMSALAGSPEDWLRSLAGELQMTTTGLAIPDMPLAPVQTLHLIAGGPDRSIRMTLDGGYDGVPVSLSANVAGIHGVAADAPITVRLEADAVPVAARFDGQVTPADPPVITAALDIARLDLDALLPAPPANPGGDAGGDAGGDGAARPAPDGWSRAPLELSVLSSIHAAIDLSGQDIRYRGLPITDLAAVVTIADGRADVDVTDMRVSEGKVEAQVIVDATDARARITAETRVIDVQARPVLAAFADMDRLSGRTRFSAEVETSGASQAELVAGLNGAGQLAFYDGVIEGINLAQTLRDIGSLGLGSGEPGRKTDFSELSGSFTIIDGRLFNRDLKMLAPLVRLSGAGQVDLPPRTLDYDAEAKLVASLEGQGGSDSLAGLPIPISVEGPWHDVRYGIQWDSMFAGLADDPARLADLPAGLREAAAKFGVDLPIPGLGGEGDAGAAGTAILNDLLPGVVGNRGQGGAGAPGGEGGILGALPELLPGLTGGGDSVAPAAPPAPAPPTAPATADGSLDSLLDVLSDPAAPIPTPPLSASPPPAEPERPDTRLEDLLPGNLFE